MPAKPGPDGEGQNTPGHGIGDGLLVAIAERLRSRVRRVDAVARLGGDEFAVFHTEAGSIDGVAELARRLMHLLEEPLDVDGNELRVTASIGIAVYPSGEAAEGVETEEQAREPARQGWDAGQGFFFGLPRPPQELERTLGADERVLATPELVQSGTLRSAGSPG